MKGKLSGLFVIFLMCIVTVSGFCQDKNQITELERKIEKLQTDTNKSLQAINKRLDSIEGRYEENYGQISPPPVGGQSQFTGSRVIKIEDRGSLRKSDIVNYIVGEKNPAISRGYVEKLIDTYIQEAEKEGINPDLAIAQMCYVTNFLKNEMLIVDYNYAGLAPISEEGRIRLNTMTQGVLAHIQHLKGYTSNVSWNQLQEPLVDPRWNMLDDIRGTIKTLDGLSKRWSPYNFMEYENKIIGIIEDLHRF